MEIVINTSEPLSDIERKVLAVLMGVDKTTPAAEVMKKEAAVVSKKAEEKPKPKPKPEPEPEPEPIAEEPLPEEPLPEEEEEPEVEEDEGDDTSDEDLLQMAVKKATEMVGSGEAAKVREALDAAGASRVRELNKDNVREFFKALS